MLEELGLTFAEINKDNLREGCCGKSLSSPTLLADDDIIIFDGETNLEQGACTTILPDKEELKTLINGLT